MKKVLFVLFLIVTSNYAFTQSWMHRNSYEVNYADSMGYYISKILPNGWSLKRNDRRLVISRKDSVCFQFMEPPNSVYDADTSIVDFYLEHPKCKLEIYVDFPLSYWTDLTWMHCKKHNDSIESAIESEITRSRKHPIEDQMRNYYNNEVVIEVLYAQMIKLPVAYIGGLAMYVSDNVPLGCGVSNASDGREDDNAVVYHEINAVKDTCEKAIKAHLKMHCTGW